MAPPGRVDHSSSGAPRARRFAATQHGAALLELVMAIVIVAVAVSAILGLLARNAASSADAMVLAQAVSVAESYIEEITLKPLLDPDGVNGESARSAYDDVNDYDGLVDVGARDQFGAAIPALAGYTVAVRVSATSALPGVPSVAAKRVDVQVTFSPDINFTLSSYKTL